MHPESTASNLVRVRAVVENMRHNMSYGRGRNFHHGGTLPDALGKGGTAILARIRVWRLAVTSVVLGSDPPAT